VSDPVYFTVFGAPRTKKTSNRIVRFGKAKEFTRILPSEAHEEWFKRAMTQAPIIKRGLLDAGFELPLVGNYNARVLFYRDAQTGDTCGYYQAIADFLQEPTWGKNGRMTRNGAGVLKDDKQIRSWDGSRLRKDAATPRIEVTLELIGEGQGALDL
jgi:hypothetical protein